MAAKQSIPISISGCGNCKKSCAIDPHHPAPHETTFKTLTEKKTGTIVECNTCTAHIKIPHDSSKPRVIKYPD